MFRRAHQLADELPARGAQLARLETFDPRAKPLHVRPAAREELAAETQIETCPMDDVGHEGVAGHEAAAREGGCERTDVHVVARPGLSLGEVAPESRLETLLALTLDGAALVREGRATGELAQQLDER